MSGEINKRKRLYLIVFLVMVLSVGSVVNETMGFEDTLVYLGNASEGDYVIFGSYE